ncbi:hypothetical protein CBER1_07018 [Cercospora berteroae]|uniref:C2H2-type domain-containing protein n=1 Tax=Cercospora berteroae TaxID=357750 RepID=A0A2S6CBS5_9PEZI|nr:hypothetical protein CBER1_07018 [Cercospora berteroae]
MAANDASNLMDFTGQDEGSDVHSGEIPVRATMPMSSMAEQHARMGSRSDIGALVMNGDRLIARAVSRQKYTPYKCTFACPVPGCGKLFVDKYAMGAHMVDGQHYRHSANESTPMWEWANSADLAKATRRDSSHAAQQSTVYHEASFVPSQVSVATPMLDLASSDTFSTKIADDYRLQHNIDFVQRSASPLQPSLAVASLRRNIKQDARGAANVDIELGHSASPNDSIIGRVVDSLLHSSFGSFMSWKPMSWGSLLRDE